MLRTRGHYAALVTIAFGILFRNFLEVNDALGGPQGHEYRLESHGRSGVVEILRAGAGHVGKCAIDGSDDIGEGDLAGWPCECPAALRASAGPDDGRAAQLGEDRAKIGRGNRLSPTDLIGGERPIGGGSQLEGSAQRIVGSPGQAHRCRIRTWRPGR